MSLIPDGIGHNAYASNSNAGPHDSGLLNDHTYALPSTGQEQQQGQQHDTAATHSTPTSSNVQQEHELNKTQLQQPPAATEEQQQQQQCLSQESEQIEVVEHQEAKDLQPQLDHAAQRLQNENYQLQFVKFLNKKQKQTDIHQIPDHNQNYIDQETQSNLIYKTKIEVNEEKIDTPKQEHIPDLNHNHIDQEAQANFVNKPEIEVNKEHNHLSIKHQVTDLNHNLIEEKTQIPDQNLNPIEQNTQKNSVYTTKIEVNEKQLPKEKTPRDHKQNLSELASLPYFLPEQELKVNDEQLPVAKKQLQLSDHNQNLIVSQSLTKPDAEVKQEQLHIAEQPQSYPNQNLINQGTQTKSVFVQEIEEDREGEQFDQPSRKKFRSANVKIKKYLETAWKSDKEYIKQLEHFVWLSRLTISVRKTLSFLRQSCERVAAEHQQGKEEEQEEEEPYRKLLLREQINGIIALHQKLVNISSLLIDNPDPRATTLINEIIKGVNCVSVLSKKLGPDADERLQEIAQPVPGPMALEVLNRIRKIIFGWYKNDEQTDPAEAGSGTGPIGDQHQRNSRKRRIAEDEPPLIKYRRVDNSFPRFIPNEVADDNVPSTSMAGREQEKENQRQFARRLSIFNAPTLTQQRVRNNASNIQIDLSDDDEPPQSSFGLGGAASYSRPSAPPGGLTSMNSDSTSSLGMRPQMLYSEAVRLGQNGFPETRINGHPNPVRSPGHGEDSLLNQEDRRSERELYLALLRNICHDKSTIRAINNTTKPPPLQLLNRTAEHSNNTWGSIFANNKPAAQQQQQQSSLSQPAKPVNPDFTNYAKLLNREQDKNTPPPLMRLNSSKSITSHASTISISESTSSSSNASDAEDNKSAKGRAAAGAAAAAAAFQDNHNGATPSKKPFKFDPNTPLPRTEDLQRRFASCRFLKDNYPRDFVKIMAKERKEFEHRTQLAAIQVEETRETRREYEKSLRAKLFQSRLTYQPLLVIGSVDTAREERVPEFLPLTEEHMVRFSELTTGPPHQVIVSKFSLQITRNDIRTLLGSSWLNDEVINFYMNLLTERSELRSGELPSVYAMNTFFVPRLLQNGHGGVKRWTRKVDLFSKDIIPVPVHCNGVHWCMAIIHMRNKTIRYYDSMGKPNQDVLDALESYLRHESLDKRKQPFDTSDFSIESVPNVPQQTNGSDCGVFSCMFAEYISRDAPITFSQDNMDYFRKKMVLEIAEGKLWK